MIPVNDVWIKDVATDISKENDTWKVLVTVFLEVTQDKKEEFLGGISCDIASEVQISQNIIIGNTSQVVLDTRGKYTSVNIWLAVPTVNAHGCLSVFIKKNQYRGVTV